jgi:hypothetical protein
MLSDNPITADWPNPVLKASLKFTPQSANVFVAT